MARTQLNFRIPEHLSDALDSHSEQTGITKTDIIINALSAYLDVDTGIVDIQDILKRLEALESKFQALGKPAPKKESIQDETLTDPAELGELITKQEASMLTGYSVNYFSGIFHRKDIYEVSKRGKEGLYRKDEILERIGFKGQL